MEPEPGADITALLRAWRSGDREALDRLMLLVYDELRRTARHYMRGEREAHTLQTTALVNEAFLRLAGARRVEYADRVHFFVVAAQMMRRVLVDYARTRGYSKRGGDATPVALEESRVASPERDDQIVALDEALDALAHKDARKAQVVELRFFSGLSVEETAAALGVSNQTVARDWTLSKAWLLRRMRRGNQG
jgi:RNA polymerase sigma factor (TIGR02999 family)